MAYESFLASLATQQTPGRPAEIRYDDDLDELTVLDRGGFVPAVDAPAGSPMTKKHDIEKGEDSKDRW